jgi:hypothetical protein
VEPLPAPPYRSEATTDWPVGGGVVLIVGPNKELLLKMQVYTCISIVAEVKMMLVLPTDNPNPDASTVTGAPVFVSANSKSSRRHPPMPGRFEC